MKKNAGPHDQGLADGSKGDGKTYCYLTCTSRLFYSVLNPFNIILMHFYSTSDHLNDFLFMNKQLLLQALLQACLQALLQAYSNCIVLTVFD